jgi:hypothetical protein
MAASRTRATDTVMWVDDMIRSRINAGAMPYAVASAHLDLAMAWEELGVYVRAEEARRSALAIALEHRFHEIAHHAAERRMVAAPVREALSTNAEEVADAVLHLAAV